MAPPLGLKGGSSTPVRCVPSAIGDETMALLESALPGISSPQKGFLDNSEDEVFFGPITSKETSTDGYKKIKKCRRTMTLEEAALMRRSSFGRDERIDEEDGEESDKENHAEPSSELEIGVKTVTPTPTPRKIDQNIKKNPLTDEAQIPVPKVRTLTPKNTTNDVKEVKSASKLLSHLQENDQDYGSDEDDGPSLIDVENDQMFDNSIFTEYNEKDISVMSSHLSNQLNRDKWREERRKTGNFVEPPAIGDLVQESSNSSRVIPETPSLTFEEVKDQTDSKERRESIASTCSDWFNTTRDEMILYEKFGEEYDVIVGKMSHQEKMKLKEEVSKATPKSAEELLGDVSLESATTGTSSFTCSGNLKPLLPVVQEEPPIQDEVVCKVMEELDPTSREESIFEPPLLSVKKDPLPVFSTPTVSRHQMNRPQVGCKTMPSYLRSTAASRLRASPNKNELSPGFGSCGKLFPEPMSGKKFAARRAVGNSRGLIDMRTIESPVSQYINSNSTPQIMRSVKPKVSRFLEEEMKCADEDVESQPIMPEPRYYAPLPEARYCSSQVALEQRVAPDVSYKELPKSFGTVNAVQAVVSVLNNNYNFPLMINPGKRVFRWLDMLVVCGFQKTLPRETGQRWLERERQ